jgi:hypothetical protein
MLTRRRYPETRDECWHVYYGDVHAGTLAIRSGNPHDTGKRLETSSIAEL